jgi:hypothetical protein
MSEIPADIAAVVRKILLQHYIDYYVEEFLRSDIALAIMEERERCAKIAEDQEAESDREYQKNHEQSDSGAAGAAAVIAEAIRKGR